MKTKHIVAIVVGGLCLVWFVWALFYWGKPDTFNRAVSIEAVQSLIAQRGLQVCSEKFLDFDQTPGFVRGKVVAVSSSCATDVNQMKVGLLQFDSVESRNAALQRANSVHRSGSGPNAVYGFGPYVITIQGSRGIVDQLLLGKILNEAGANP